MKRIERITVDLMSQNYDEIQLKQLDTTELIFKILDNNNEVSLSEKSANIIFMRPDRTIVIQECSIDSNKVKVTLSKNCVRVPGLAKIEVEIKENEEIISSFFINAFIEKTSKENIKADDIKLYLEEFEDVLKELRSNLEDKINTKAEELINERIDKDEEKARKANEDERKSNEILRQEQEEKRKTEEEKRNTDEKERITKEIERETTENIRIENEETRKNNELARQSAETNRVNAEKARETEEESRALAESEREKSEIEREVYITELKEHVESGDFKGEKGDTGEKGEKGEPGEVSLKQMNELISSVVTEFEKENKELRQDMNNILPSIVGAGEKVTLNGTAEATMKQFKIYGNSLQETEPSMESPSTIRHCGDSNINKFDLNTFDEIQDGYITYEKLDNGIRVKSQVAGTGPYWGKFKILDDVSNLVGKTINIRMNFKTTGKNTALALLRLINPEDYNDNYGLDGATKLASTGTGEIRLSAVIPEDAKTKPILGIILYANWSGEITKEDCVEYTDIKLVVGEEIKGYSSYNAGTIETVLAHKNLLKPTWAQDLLDRLGVSVSSTDNCITEIDGHRYLKYKANLGYNTGLEYFIKDIFKENTQYTFKTIMMKDNDAQSSNITFSYTDNSKYAPALSQTANMTPIEYKITSYANKTVNNIKINNSSGSTYIDIDNTILYEGTEDEPYEDYAQIYNFPTKPGQVFYNEDYLAEDGIHHVETTIELDGSEDEIWEMPGSQGNHIETLLSRVRIKNGKNISAKVLCKSNLFTGKADLSWREEGEGIWVGYNYLNVSIKRSRLPSEDIEGIRAFLAEQKTNGKPLIVDYELETEVIEPYTPEQQEVWNKIKKIRSYDGVTQVFSTDEISPKFDVEAFSKVQGEHDKLQAQIDAIKALLSTTKTSAMLVDNLEKDLIEEVKEIC